MAEKNNAINTNMDSSIPLEETNTNPPELFCSRMTRLYGKDGKLCQGTSSFYTFNRSSLN
jgi:hypothetical protein